MEKIQTYTDIPAEKFTFAQADKKLGDKKLQTKPVSYMRDAWRRFAKNKSSIVGMVIIAILLLFALIAPLASNYSIAYNDGYYRNVLPKVSAHADSGFWDGTKRYESNLATYQYNHAMGVESGRLAVKDFYGTKVVESSGSSSVLYSYRLDTYNAVGYEFVTLTRDQLDALQEYQNKTNIQVMYPMLDTSTRNQVMYNTTDANYWYKTVIDVKSPNNGQAVLDEKGNYIPLYLTGSATVYNLYNSLRIKGDPGLEDPTSADSYLYYRVVQGGYRVRVIYYEYYTYLNGFEPCHVFGASASGQDLFTLVAAGTRFSLMLAVGVAVVNLIIGAIYGAIEGFYGGKLDLFMERIADILNGVPFMVVAVLFNMHLAATAGVVGALLFAFVLTGWIGTAATVRMQFYRFKKQEYVLAAKTLGARDRRLIMKHIFPNSLGTIITSAALYIPSVIFSETSLSYLGVISLNDTSNGIISLGTLLTAGQGAISTYPHIVLFPALVIALLMISFNLFGNGLRDAFNPSLRGSDS